MFVRFYVWNTTDGLYTCTLHTHICVCICISVYAFIALSLWFQVSLLTRATTYVRQIRHADLLFLVAASFNFRSFFLFFPFSLKSKWINRRLCYFNWWYRYESDRCLLNSRIFLIFFTYFFSAPMFIFFPYFVCIRSILWQYVRVRVCILLQRNITFDICLVINKQQPVQKYGVYCIDITGWELLSC